MFRIFRRRQCVADGGRRRIASVPVLRGSGHARLRCVRPSSSACAKAFLSMSRRRPSIGFSRRPAQSEESILGSTLVGPRRPPPRPRRSPRPPNGSRDGPPRRGHGRPGRASAARCGDGRPRPTTRRPIRPIAEPAGDGNPTSAVESGRQAGATPARPRSRSQRPARGRHRSDQGGDAPDLPGAKGEAELVPFMGDKARALTPRPPDECARPGAALDR